MMNLDMLTPLLPLTGLEETYQRWITHSAKSRVSRSTVAGFEISRFHTWWRSCAAWCLWN